MKSYTKTSRKRQVKKKKKVHALVVSNDFSLHIVINGC